MKIKLLLDLSNDASDLLDFFENVATPEQLTSRLERLKRGAPEEMLACIEGLRASLSNLLEDTIEASGSLDGDDGSDPDENDIQGLISELENTDNPETSPEPPTAENQDAPNPPSQT